MSGWVIESLGSDDRTSASRFVGETLLSYLGRSAEQPAGFRFTAQAYELAVSTLLNEPESSKDLREAAELAFEATRSQDLPQDDENHLHHLLTVACYGIIADRTPDVARYLRAQPLPNPAFENSDWGNQVRCTVYRLWLLLLRKSGWADLDAVQAEVVALRESQKSAEESYLEAVASPRAAAWELICSYHLSKAVEILAVFTSQGSVSGGFNVREQIQAQFDRAETACQRAELTGLYSTVQLLTAASEKLIANSIWTVTRAVNSRVSRFVANLTDRAQEKPIFEMLPPQRITLRENGLLGSGHRSVVVSLPTSSGKTLIAQFRILQALNQFDTDRGWVAYVAPTRALVNQVCARLRRDFNPLGVVVERVSPALDIDGVEAELLSDANPATAFRVLVGTPEKIDLLLRQGWEGKIGRPLTLVVVDEAHNLSAGERGLKLELLLASINRECRQSQFLLLTPFIQNGAEIARWLSPDSHTDMSVQFDWRPNDRAIVTAKPAPTDQKGDFTLAVSTVHTSRNSIEVDGEIQLCGGRELGLTWSEVKNSQSNVAAVTASCLNMRGPVIVVAGQVPHTWTIARTLAADPDQDKKSEMRSAAVGGRSSDDIDFVSSFVAQEFGEDFELINLLQKRIGLHHTGLSEDVRVLMEWLVERGQLDTLVATTTIAQGVNFPVTGVVLAAHQYPYGEDMSPEDFWNLAGRAGRADQAGTGVIALAATTDARADLLRNYVNRNVSSLNSTLIDMVAKALQRAPLLELQSLHWMKEWSAFLQYLAHSYRQIGDHAEFSSQIEQVLRGSFGFQKIRQVDVNSANRLVAAVQDYAAIIRNKPLALVDSTGFSWESVSRALANLNEAGLKVDAWDPAKLFSAGDDSLKRAFGVLFKVPEIREELGEVTGGKGKDGDLLARIVKDWVAGASIPQLAADYFTGADGNQTEAITKACRAVYGKLTLTASWGLSALQSLTAGDAVEKMSESERRSFKNLPSQIYYGVSSDDAIDLRLLGVPRNAAQPLANLLKGRGVAGVQSMRTALNGLDEKSWNAALGPKGFIYQRAWKVLEGID